MIPKYKQVENTENNIFYGQKRFMELRPSFTSFSPSTCSSFVLRKHDMSVRVDKNTLYYIQTVLSGYNRGQEEITKYVMSLFEKNQQRPRIQWEKYVHEISKVSPCEVDKYLNRHLMYLKKCFGHWEMLCHIVSFVQKKNVKKKLWQKASMCCHVKWTNISRAITIYALK